MPTRKQPTWLAGFETALSQGDLAGALALLDARATAHAGAAPATDKRAAAKALLSHASKDDVWALARELAASDSPTRRELACLLLPACYEDHRRDVVAPMLPLADDAHWEVRLWASGLFQDLLAAHFDELYGTYRDWTAHESQFVRVAVATSVMSAGHRRHPERAAPLLDLVEMLLTDGAPEVGRNLGPFAVGAALLRFFPDETLARVRRWAASDDEMTRWNAAMVFVAAEGRKHVDVALELLSDLARDPRRRIWQAVGSALRNLAKGDPQRLRPVLEEWSRDERRRPASLAMRALDRR